MKAVRLKTEYLQDPLGIDIPHPRLFWTCEDVRSFHFIFDSD